MDFLFPPALSLPKCPYLGGSLIRSSAFALRLLRRTGCYARSPPTNRRKPPAGFPCRGRHRKPSRVLLVWRFVTPHAKPPRQLAPLHAILRSFLTRGMSAAASPQPTTRLASRPPFGGLRVSRRQLTPPGIRYDLRSRGRKESGASGKQIPFLSLHSGIPQRGSLLLLRPSLILFNLMRQVVEVFEKEIKKADNVPRILRVSCFLFRFWVR